MDFDAWKPRAVDRLRVRRLFIGHVVGAVGVSLGLAFVFLTSKGASAVEEEDPAIEAQLVTEPEPEPEPEPPPPEPEPEEPKPPPPPRVVAPVEIPKEAPKEAEAKPASAEEEDPFEPKEAPAPSAATAVVEAPAPAPPPKPKVLEKPKPIRVTEDVTPPEAISQTMPEYPPAVKAQGIDGVVVVKYVVNEKGEVTELKVLKGPPELHATCLAAMRSWRFRPAILEGKPVAVIRTVRFPFRIKT